MDDLDPVVDCFTVHTCHGVPLPPGVTSDLFQKAADELTWLFQYLISYPSIQDGTKANIGFLIANMYQVGREVSLTIIFW